VKDLVTDFGQCEVATISKIEVVVVTDMAPGAGKIGLSSIDANRIGSAPLATHSHLRGTLETPISFTLMVHHIVLYKLKPEVTPARVEDMMMNARMQLLKIPEVLSIKCGKRIDPESDWPFFIAIDFESMDKYTIFREDSIFVKFNEEVIKPNTEDCLTLDFEMDPGKDVRFS